MLAQTPYQSTTFYFLLQNPYPLTFLSTSLSFSLLKHILLRMNLYLQRSLKCLLLWLYFFQMGIAQNCGSDILHQHLLQSSKEYKQTHLQQNKDIAAATMQLQSEKATQKLDDEILTIPVVVHILHHPSLSVGQGSNIPESQVHQAITHLNEALQNHNDYQTHHGVNAKIEFCLATKNEADASTTGINRFPTVEFSEIDMVEDEPQFKAQTIRWDSHDYLNIWVVDEICSPNIPDNPCSVVGYSYTAQVHGSVRDGVVIEAGRFGGTTDESKILVHEVGHYLNLQHTFNNGCKNDNCLMDGDFVCDTPPENSTAGVDCSQGKHANSCTSDIDDTNSRNPFRPQFLGGLGDQNDLSNNYMDYNYKDCLDSFTKGQKDRMRISLTTTRKSLLESGKCGTVVTPPDDTLADAGISEILTPNGFTCKNYVVLEVKLTNFFDKPLKTVNIHYQLNGGNSQVYFWQGTLQENQSETVELPKTLFVSENIQTIRVYTTNPNNLEDENTGNNAAEANFFNMPLQELPFFDDFEEESIGSHWSIYNPDGLQSWQTQHSQNCNPNEYQSLALNSHSYSNSLEESDLLQLYMDMQNLSSAELRFDVAYSAYSLGFSETLRVFASKDCGENYLKIYEKSGLELATSNAYQTQDWNPKDCSDWRTEIVDLSQFAGSKMQLYFEAINRNGNNLFIDNISIHDKNETSCDAPSNLSIEVTTADRAALNWSEKSDVFAYNVWFKPIGTEDWSIVTIETGDEKVVTGLQPSTAYEMQLQSICTDGGTSLFSNRQFFQTLDLPVCYSPLQQRVETIQSNSALLRWEQAGDSESYTVRYRKLGSDNWSLAFGKKDSAEVRNLVPETTYEAAVRSKCVNGTTGNSEYGDILVFRTTAECPSPSHIKIVSTSIDEATITYNLAPESSLVNFKYRAKNVTQWTDSGTTDSEEHTFNGLKSGTVYEIQGAGICGNQQGNYSRSAVFSTETLCDAPKNFSYTFNSSNNLVVINWDVAEEAALYELEYKQILPTEGSEWKSIVVGSTTAYLSNLEQGSVYHYKVRSQCDDNAPTVQNNSYFSSIQSFVTNVNCDIPSGLKTDVVGNESAQLSWQTSTPNTTFEARYRIQSSANWQLVEITENKVELVNLESNTDYEFEVRAQCGAFPTDFSQTFFFKTKDTACAISPTELEAVEIKNRNATLYWVDSGSSTEYKFAYRVSNQIEWTESIVNNRYVVLEDLQPCFVYEYKVASICENGQSDFSSSRFFTTECVSYCPISSGSAQQNWIETFGIEGKEFTSYGEASYTYFEEEEIELSMGKNYTADISIDIAGKISNQYLSVWIDFNQDYVFEASEIVWQEEIDVESFLENNVFRTSSILEIPDNIPLGVTRMRVVLSASNVATPCEYFDLGEVEDYKVKIISLKGGTDNLELLSLQLSPNPANESVVLQFGKTTKIENWNLKVIDINGRIVLEEVIHEETQIGEYRLNTSHLQKGVYLIIIEGNKDRQVQKLFIGD